MLHRAVYNRALLYLRQGAERRGLACTITLAQYAQLQAVDYCFYCCIRLPRVHDHVQTVGARRHYGHGLDRMDSRKGYTWSNVVQACKTCNASKGGKTPAAEYLRWQAYMLGMSFRDQSCQRFGSRLTFRTVRDWAVLYRQGVVTPPLWRWRAGGIRRAAPC